MAFSEKRFHQEFRPETIERQISLVSPELLAGDRPYAFVRELVTFWEFSTNDWGFKKSPHWVVKLVREELPESFQAGFGLHCGAVMTSASSIPTLLNNDLQLQAFYEERVLDARFCRGEFAGFAGAR